VTELQSDAVCLYCDRPGATEVAVADGLGPYRWAHPTCLGLHRYHERWPNVREWAEAHGEEDR